MPWSFYCRPCVSFVTLPGNTPNECTIHKHTTTCKKFKSTMCRTTDREWNNFRKLLERCGKCNECESSGAMLSAQETTEGNKCGSSMLTTQPGKEAGMEKWSAQESDRTLYWVIWAGCNGLYVWMHIIGGVQLEI